MTSPLRRIVTERRWLALTLAAALLVNVAVFVLLVRPLTASSRGAGARAAAAAEAVQAAEQGQAAVEALVSTRQRAEQELGVFYQTILPESLSAARRLTYASLPALARQTRVQYQGRSFDVNEPAPDRQLSQLTIRMELQGQYESLRQFIYEVERAPAFVIIDDVTLTERDTAEPLTLAITLSTYFRLAGHGF